MVYSDYALREGVLLDAWQRHHGGSLHHLSDLRRRSVVNLAKDGQRREFRHRRLRRSEPESVTAIPEIDETWALVRQLPVTQRAVVVLHYYEDLSLVEISHLLDRPASTVRSDLRRALTRLRKALP